MERRETVILKEGFLSKKGGFVHSWRKRWFKCSLSPPSFSYYTKKGGELIKKVTVEPQSRVGVVPAHHNYSFGFAIAMQSRTWVFDAESEVDREEWINAVTQMVAVANQNAAGGKKGAAAASTAASPKQQQPQSASASATAAAGASPVHKDPLALVGLKGTPAAETMAGVHAVAAASAAAKSPVAAEKKESIVIAAAPIIKRKPEIGLGKVLVFGASGLVGGHVVNQLLEEHQSVVAAVRSKDKGVPFAKRGAEVAVCDSSDEASLVAAMKGVDRIFLLSPFSNDFFPGEQAILAAAKKADKEGGQVQFVARLSVIGSDERSPMLPAQKHGKCDALLKSSEFEWCILAPTFFFQNIVNYHPEIKANNCFIGAAGNTPYSHVDARDIARAAALILCDPVFHFKKTYNLATQLASDSDIATKISSVVRKKIAYKQMEEQPYLDMMAPFTPAWQLAMVKDLENIKRNGWAGTTSPDFEKLTGQKPRTLEAYLAENSAAFSTRVHGVGESLVVLVTGASGRLGRATVTHLASKYPHTTIRAGVRDIKRGIKLFRAWNNVSVVHCDTAVNDSLTACFAGVDSVLVIPPMSKRMEDVYAYAAAAKKSPSVRLVAMVAHSCAGDASLLGRHWATLCDMLIKTGLPTCFLYCNLFFELLFRQVSELRKTGTLMSPAHSHDRITQIATDDVGACAGSVLVEPDRYANCKFTLTGSEALSFAELAQVYSHVCQTPIEYKRIPSEQFAQLVHTHYDNTWQGDAVVELWKEVSENKNVEISNEVERITGRVPATVEEMITLNVAPVFHVRVPVLVLGATGSIGSHVVRYLSQYAGNSWSIRAATRNPNSDAAKALTRLPHVSVVAVDVADAKSVAAAAQGVTRVYYQSFGGNAHVEQEGRLVTDALLSAGVKYVVKLSSLNIAKDHVLGAEHRSVENYMRSKALRVVSLQPASFMSGLVQNFAGSVKSGGAAYVPVNTNTPFNWVDNRDVGEVAALCLTQSGHTNKSYMLCGPDKPTMTQVATLLSELTDKQVAHVHPGDEGYAATLAGFGLQESFIKGLIDLYHFMDRGGYNMLSADVEAVTGHKPRSIKTYLSEHRAAFCEPYASREPILVLGATGNVGQWVVSALSTRATTAAGAHISVLAATRNPNERVAKVLSKLPHVQLVTVDINDEKSVVNALKGVSKVWFQQVQGHPDPVPEGKRLVDLFEANGVQLVVKLSAFNIRDDYLLGMAHREIEDYIRAKSTSSSSKLRLVSIQPSSFFSNLLNSGLSQSVREQGVIYDTLGDDVRVNWVDNRDIADVAAAVFVEPGHAGHTYSPAGQILTPQQLAITFSHVLGKPVKHVTIPADNFKEALNKMGAPAKVVDGMLDLYSFFTKGGYDNVSDDIMAFSHGRPRSLHHFIREHAANFTKKPRIGVLGSGEVGQTLAAGLLKFGYPVMLGSRDPAKPEIVGWLASNFSPLAAVGTFSDAADFGDIVVVATRDGGDTKGSLTTAGLERLAKKIVWDTVNPLAFAADGSASLTMGHNTSHGESVQKWLPQSKVVKVFNATGANDMVYPVFEDGEPTMFLAGDDRDANATTTSILHDLGWLSVVELGGIVESRVLEPMAVLWLRYSMQHNFSSHHAFSMLTK